MVGNETACVLSGYITMACLIRLPFIRIIPDLHPTWLCRIHCTVVKSTELTCLKYLTIQTWRHLHSIKAEEISLPASCLDFIHSLLICPLFHFRTWERLWIWSAATQICKTVLCEVLVSYRLFNLMLSWFHKVVLQSWLTFWFSLKYISIIYKYQQSRSCNFLCITFQTNHNSSKFISVIRKYRQ